MLKKVNINVRTISDVTFIKNTVLTATCVVYVTQAIHTLADISCRSTAIITGSFAFGSFAYARKAVYRKICVEYWCVACYKSTTST